MKCSKVILLVVFLGICYACSEKSHIAEPLPKITILTATNGVGDNGYNDLILAGVMQVYESHNISLSLITPATLEEAKNVLNEWVHKESSGTRELLVLASNEYEILTDDIDAALSSDKYILLIESDKDIIQENVSSVFIRRYGISYLSGCMARRAESAYVISAMDTDSYIKDAVKGFVEGYSSDEKDAKVIYLAEDESGYSMPGEAYKTMREIDYNAFVYPLAGGSNNGMYKSTREQEFCLQLIAGMDVDCSQYSTRVPFSVVFDIKRIVASLLEEWIIGGELEKQYVFDISDEDIVSVIINPDFYRDMITWEEWYDSPYYWNDTYIKFKNVAKEKEEEYYEGR